MLQIRRRNKPRTTRIETVSIGEDVRPSRVGFGAWQKAIRGYRRVSFLFFPSWVVYGDGRRSLVSREARQRKVRTPYGSMPRRKRGRDGCKTAATESVTEKIPPVL